MSSSDGPKPPSGKCPASLHSSSSGHHSMTSHPRPYLQPWGLSWEAFSGCGPCSTIPVMREVGPSVCGRHCPDLHGSRLAPCQPAVARPSSLGWTCFCVCSPAPLMPDAGLTQGQPPAWACWRGPAHLFGFCLDAGGSCLWLPSGASAPTAPSPICFSSVLSWSLDRAPAS